VDDRMAVCSERAHAPWWHGHNIEWAAPIVNCRVLTPSAPRPRGKTRLIDNRRLSLT
jgi:hypothetical protein